MPVMVDTMDSLLEKVSHLTGLEASEADAGLEDTFNKKVWKSVGGFE